MPTTYAIPFIIFDMALLNGSLDLFLHFRRKLVEPIQGVVVKIIPILDGTLDVIKNTGRGATPEEVREGNN